MRSSDTSKPLVFGSGSSEFMRIVSSSGNVGIGTTSPSNKLHVNSGNTNEVARFESTDSVAYLSIMDNNTTYSLQGIGSIGDALTLYNNNSEKIRINSSGDVGIGTNSPLGILHVADANPEFILEDTTNLNRNKIENVDGNMRYHADYGSNIGNSRHIFFIDNSEKVRFDTNGNVGIGTTSPTVKLDVNGEIAIRGGEGADDARMYFRASDQSNRFTIETDFDGSSTNDILGFRSVNTDNILTLKGNGNVGIGTISPASKLEVDGGDIEVDDSASGLILRSPNGTRYRIQVDNSGNLTTTAV
jgi:hypothetical protein